VTRNPIPNATKAMEGQGRQRGQTDREAGQTLCNHKATVFRFMQRCPTLTTKKWVSSATSYRHFMPV